VPEEAQLPFWPHYKDVAEGYNKSVDIFFYNFGYRPISAEEKGSALEM
jgi:hypothetical protein